MDLNQLINNARKDGGSEIHLKVASAPLMRQQKFLKRLSMPAIVPEDISQVFGLHLSEDERKKAKEGEMFEKNVWGTGAGNFCLTIFPIQGQPSIIIRVLPEKVPTFEEMRLPAQLSIMLERKGGLLVLSGPPRSGLMNTVAALVHKINISRAAHILLIQDQLQYIFQTKKARISQRQLGKDLMSIDAGINFAKKMDVDALVIGELKREPPYRSIFDYVNGGNFCILSMQTLGVQATLETLLHSFHKSDQDFISNILAQDLLGVCSQTILVDPLERKTAPIFELLVMNSSMHKLIQQGRANQIEANLKTAGQGSFLFESDVNQAVKGGFISKEVADGFMTWYRGTRGP